MPGSTHAVTKMTQMSFGTGKTIFCNQKNDSLPTALIDIHEKHGYEINISYKCHYDLNKSYDHL